MLSMSVYWRAIPSGKLTWQWKSAFKSIYKSGIFHVIYLSLPEGITLLFCKRISRWWFHFFSSRNLGKVSNLTVRIFFKSVGWNHQLGILYHPIPNSFYVNSRFSGRRFDPFGFLGGDPEGFRRWNLPEGLGQASRIPRVVLFQSCLWLGTIDVNNHTNTVNLIFLRGYKFYQTYFLELQTFSFSRFFFGVFKGVRNMYHQKSELNPSGEIGPGSSGFPYHRWDWYTYVDPYLEDPCMVYIYLYI